MTQFNATTYDIQRPTGHCAFTGRALQPGEAYMATLVELTDDDIANLSDKAMAALGMRRLDVSIEAWQEGKRPEHLFSYWKATIAQPNQKKKLFVDDDVLMNLFRRLADTDNEQRQAFRFVLGLILMRKKLLRYVGSERRPGPVNADGQPTTEEWWLMTPRKEEQPLEMLNPHLDEAKIQAVTEQIGSILEAEL